VGLKPFRAIPQTLVEWERWCNDQDIGSSTSSTAATSSSVTRSSKYWAFDSPAGVTGTFYFGGYYLPHSAAFTPAGGTNVGTVNSSYAAHAYVVLGAISSDMVVSVTGTSINDSGTRTAADSELIYTAGGQVNDFYETRKKWIGQVSYALDSGTGVIINAGFDKYWDFGNTDFTVVGLEATWHGSATDAGANIELLHHKADGWTYAAGGTAVPPTAIASMNTDHVTEISVVNTEPGAWKRTNLSTTVKGSVSEGVVWQITTTANKAFELGNLELTVTQ
jgi:hypothetical protein